MEIEDLDREQVEAMSGDEVTVCFETLRQTAEVAAKRKHILGMIEVREASGPQVIKIDSTVVD